MVVDDEAASLQTVAGELESRYGTHYRIVASPSAEDALTRLADLRAEGARVPLILADQWMPVRTGIELLARARELHPAARRGLLVSWGDMSTSAPIVEAMALGQIEFYLPKPAWSPDEQFHRVITESLGEWWRQHGAARFEAVTVIGEAPSARGHEIRDILTRNSVPFGFIRSDSAEGQAALRRLGVPEAAGPVVALYTGAVLVDPSNWRSPQPSGRPCGRILPEAVAAAAYEFITGPLLVDPHRIGNRLLPPMDDRSSARRGTYRVIYRIDDKAHVVTVVDVGHRRDVYRT